MEVQPKARMRQPRSPLWFKETDFTRAVKAARKAGFVNPRVLIKRDGTMVIEDSDVKPGDVSDRTPDDELADWKRGKNAG